MTTTRDETCLEASLHLVHDDSHRCVGVTFAIAGVASEVVAKFAVVAAFDPVSATGSCAQTRYANGEQLVDNHHPFGDVETERTSMSYDAYVASSLGSVRARMIETLVYVHRNCQLDDAERATVKRYIETHGLRGLFYANYRVWDLVSVTVAAADTQLAGVVPDAVAALDAWARSGGRAVTWNPPASDATVAALETRLGTPLPSSLRAFLRLHDGGTIASTAASPIALAFWSADRIVRVNEGLFAPTGKRDATLIVCGEATLDNDDESRPGRLAFLGGPPDAAGDLQFGHLYTVASMGATFLSPRREFAELLHTIAKRDGSV